MRTLDAALADHLYTCNADVDMCYEAEPVEGETWADFTARRAAHISDVIKEWERSCP